LPLKQRRLVHGRVVVRPSEWEWSIDGGAPVLLLPAIDQLLGPSCQEAHLENSN